MQHEQLPVAPPPKPRELTEDELKKMDRQSESVLRELRMFLRDATNKLLAERKFKEFTHPVDPEEVRGRGREGEREGGRETVKEGGRGWA